MKRIINIITNLLFVAVFSMAVSVATGVRFIIPFAIINIVAYCLNDFIPDYSAGIRVYTAAGGAATPFAFNINYLPQFITYNPAANPLTSLKISMKGTVLHDWNAAHIAAVNGYMCNGPLPTNNVLLRVATGHMPNQDVTISGVTSAAGAIDFFVSSDNEASTARPFMSRVGQILALTPTMFENFTALFIPALAVGTDRVEVLFNNGHRQIWENQEIQALSGLYQNTSNVIINNVNSYISQVWAICAASTPAYILSVAL